MKKRVVIFLILAVFCAAPVVEAGFVDNGNGTVTDNATGLIWQQGEPGGMTWNSAISYCYGLTLGGESNWRLPNIQELESLIDTRYTPKIDPNYFPAAYASVYWSSTTITGNPNYDVLGVDFFDSRRYEGYQSYGSLYVRCVRSGQSGSLGNLVLSLSETGTGTGTVTSNPAGISCGSTCSASFTQGASVTLNANPDIGSAFTGWSGGVCSGTGTCTVTMNAAKSVTANFTAQPHNSVSTNSLSFGSVQVRSTSNQTITVTNNGNAALSITAIATTNPLVAPFSITGGTCGSSFPITVGASANCTITVHFAPTTITGSPFSGSFNISSNDPANPVIMVTVSGTATTVPSPVIAVTDSVLPANDNSIPFGDVTVNAASDQTVTITNNGNANLLVLGIATTNPLSAPFTITGGTCGATPTLAGGSSCTITVHFAPTTTAGSPFTGSFNITSNDPVNSAITVNVSGTATSVSVPQITVLTATSPGNDLTVKFWQLATSETATAQVEVKNTGTADLVLGTINWVSPPAGNPFSLQQDNCSGQTISAGNSCVFAVVFAPTTAGTFSNITLGIPGNDPAAPVTNVTVSGNAVAPGTPPPAPVRNYPKDGDTSVPSSFAFQWHKSLVSGTVSYEVCYWMDGAQASTLHCLEPVVATASLQKKGGMFAGGASTGILFFGIAFAGVVRSRKQLLMVIGLLVVTSLFIGSCGGGGNKVSTPSDLVQSGTVSLQGNTTYDWFVIASGDGGSSTSDTGHFTTQ